ncbi:prepilin peptidase [Nesterenkonia natronophila]|uniref:Prepilin peptidase n=1 Tax=Nesterenkonia natronophila TaxID=2174932 RepID=A0A3A4F3N9_9MICC|nr:A24 family peptidase [Nesterenkonia natronophila]RJN32456.1 prepilin peptidase [Nesterenkonia natronophila]
MTAESLWALAITALLAALLAWCFTPVVRAFAEPGTVWLRTRAHLPLAALAGWGAAVVAESAAELVALAAVGVGCSLLIVIDLVSHRLPDLLVAGTLGALLVPLVVASSLGHQWSALGRSLLAGMVLLLGYFLLALITPSGLGLGDVKFAAVIGCLLGWFGWSEVAMGTLLGFTINGVIALVLVLSRGGGRSSEIPFGPSMVFGAVLAVAISV